MPLYGGGYMPMSICQKIHTHTQTKKINFIYSHVIIIHMSSDPIKPIVERLRQFGSGAVISNKLLWKILTEELTKRGVYSREGIRGYYQVLRDMGVIKEIGGVQRVQNDDGSIQKVKYIRIMLGASEDFDYHLTNPINAPKCSKCGKVFKDAYELGSHMLNCNVISCEFCGKQFNTTGELREHLYMCAKSPFYYKK